LQKSTAARRIRHSGRARHLPGFRNLAIDVPQTAGRKARTAMVRAI
jgi:hypothetical protein